MNRSKIIRLLICVFIIAPFSRGFAEENLPLSAREIVESAPDVIVAMNKAFLYAVNQPKFYPDWREKKDYFDGEKASKLSSIFIDTSIRRRFQSDSERGFILYNPGSDTYMVISLKKDGTVAGLIPATYLLSKIFKTEEPANYIDAFVSQRPSMLNSIVDLASERGGATDIGQRYKWDRNVSDAVRVNMAAFGELSKATNSFGCGDQVKSHFMKSGAKFLGAPDNDSLGEFYYSITYPVVLEGEKKLSGALLLQDRKTSGYVAFAVYDTAGPSKCKVRKIVTVSF